MDDLLIAVFFYGGINDGKELSEQTLEELWEMFPITN